jgi:hypothetical protein
MEMCVQRAMKYASLSESFWLRAVRQENMVMGPAEPETENDCAVEGHQECIRNHLFPKLFYSHNDGVVIKEFRLIF